MILLLLYSLFASFCLMLLVFILYGLTRNPSIVDGFWPITVTVNAFIMGYHNLTGSVYVYGIYGCLLLWMIRLGGYLWMTRIFPNHVDKRYVALSQKWKIKKSIGFLFNYLVQGLLAWILAIPFFLMKVKPMLSIFFYVSLGFVLMGIVFEAISDYQLRKFKKYYPGKVCDVGFWFYSRHPNYFFEWLVWLGFSFVAISMNSIGWISLISPMMLLWIFLFVTGPLTEKSSLLSRGLAFEDYQKTTSFFMLWFKRRIHK